MTSAVIRTDKFRSSRLSKVGLQWFNNFSLEKKYQAKYAKTKVVLLTTRLRKISGQTLQKIDFPETKCNGLRLNTVNTEQALYRNIKFRLRWKTKAIQHKKKLSYQMNPSPRKLSTDEMSGSFK